MISDASKLIDVEAHVLRYWEDELGIEIPRNEMGHRYYTDKLIELFKEIKELKDQGFLLKAIKMLLPELENGHSLTLSEVKTLSEYPDTEPKQYDNPSKMEQFQQILGNIVAKALEDNNASLGNSVSSQVSEKVIKQMDYLLRIKEEQEEERFKKLDEAIRAAQKSQIKQTKSPKLFSKKPFFGKSLS